MGPQGVLRDTYLFPVSVSTAALSRRNLRSVYALFSVGMVMPVTVSVDSGQRDVASLKEHNGILDGRQAIYWVLPASSSGCSEPLGRTV